MEGMPWELNEKTAEATIVKGVKKCEKCNNFIPFRNLNTCDCDV